MDPPKLLSGKRLAGSFCDKESSTLIGRDNESEEALVSDVLHDVEVYSDSDIDPSLAKRHCRMDSPTAPTMQVIKDKGKSTSGHIESLELFNFMCHRHLLIKLNPHINFIFGNNGSGKSAILTALTVALGGRASSTQRATNVDNLIREGASHGRVRVKLFNGGDSPFQPDQYGEHIVLERSFRRGGANSYAISRADGRLTTGKREEINVICDHFGIQVDNPLAVLTQETAKRFLANAKPKELYEFFLKATQLERLYIDYNYVMDKIQTSTLKLEQSKAVLFDSWSSLAHLSWQSLEPLKSSILRLERQLADLERVKRAHQRIQQLRSQLTWAMIKECETEVQELQKAVEAKERRVKAIEQKITQYQESISNILTSINTLENSMAEKHQQLNPLLSQKTSLSAEVRQQEQTLSELKMDAHSINREFGSLRSQLEDLNRRISEEANKKSDSVQSHLRSRMAELETELVTINKDITDGRAAEPGLATCLGDLQRTIASINAKKQDINRQLDSAKEALHLAEQSCGNRVLAYGPRMIEVLESICRTTSFSKPPIGPVGLHVKLKDEKWTLAMEAILHSNVESFIVNSHQDRVILQKILQKYSLTNPITVVHFDGAFDYSSGCPDRRYLTALSMLDIENDVVRKMLIIFCQIESTVLVEDWREGRALARQRIRNISSIYTSDRKINSGIHTTSIIQLYRTNNRVSLVNDPKRTSEELRHRISELGRMFKVINKEYERALSEQQSCQKKGEEASNAIALLERRARAIRNDLRQLEGELVTSQSTEIGYSVFEQERQEIEERMARLGSQYQANTTQQEQLAHDMDQTKKSLRDVEEQASLVRQEHASMVGSLEDVIRSRKSIEREIDVLVKQRLAEQSSSKDSQSQMVEMQKKFEEMTEAARRICPRVEVESSVAELDKELTAQEECLRQSEQSRLDPIQVRDDLLAKRAQYKEAESAIVVNEQLLRSLDEALEQRQRAWVEFRKSVSKMSSTEFIFMLNARGFQGSLEYRHNERELHIKVIPQGQQRPQEKSQTSQRRRFDPSASLAKRIKKGDGLLPEELENRDVKQLSGGEKSYSTACFLFSLWQAMGSPMRCLDEFDVYMDPVNRSFILELLVSHARASGVQFMLITPNAIPESYKGASDVTIYKLRDPDRGQTTIV